MSDMHAPMHDDAATRRDEQPAEHFDGNGLEHTPPRLTQAKGGFSWGWLAASAFAAVAFIALLLPAIQESRVPAPHSSRQERERRLQEIAAAELEAAEDSQLASLAAESHP